MNCDLNTPIPDWIIEYPETAIVFQELGLDVSCAGKSLEYVCRQVDLSPSTVLARLRQVMDS